MAKTVKKDEMKKGAAKGTMKKGGAKMVPDMSKKTTPKGKGSK